MPISVTQPLRVPPRLVTETRGELRDAALQHLEFLAAQGASVLALDLADVGEVDIGGVGILVLVQKRAREKGLHVRLLNTPSAVQRLLELTQLDYLFQFGA